MYELPEALRAAYAADYQRLTVHHFKLLHMLVNAKINFPTDGYDTLPKGRKYKRATEAEPGGGYVHRDAILWMAEMDREFGNKIGAALAAWNGRRPVIGGILGSVDEQFRPDKLLIDLRSAGYVEQDDSRYWLWRATEDGQRFDLFVEGD